MAKRGSRIDRVPGAWLEECDQWRLGQGLTFAQLGHSLARVVGRKMAYNKGTISRYLSGEVVTDEITRAFAALMNVPYPAMFPETSAAREWCALGIRLEKADPESFGAALVHARKLLEAAELVKKER